LRAGVGRGRAEEHHLQRVEAQLRPSLAAGARELAGEAGPGGGDRVADRVRVLADLSRCALINEDRVMDEKLKRSVLSLTVVVASLGYFVDIYDLQLFNLVAEKSLKGIGITDPGQLSDLNYLLFLYQMGGMLLGGLIWGVLGDKRGRK